jgi:hypothetical protein
MHYNLAGVVNIGSIFNGSILLNILSSLRTPTANYYLFFYYYFAYSLRFITLLAYLKLVRLRLLALLFLNSTFKV